MSTLQLLPDHVHDWFDRSIKQVMVEGKSRGHPRALVAHMVEAWLVAEPRAITTEEITDECNDRSGTSESAGVRLRQTVDASPSTP